MVNVWLSCSTTLSGSPVSGSVADRFEAQRLQKLHGITGEAAQPVGRACGAGEYLRTDDLGVSDCLDEGRR